MTDSRTPGVEPPVQHRAPLPPIRFAELAQAIGNEAFALVRKGLRGEPNAFYAFERGYVVGTPFSAGPITDEVAGLMVRFGFAFVCIFMAPEQGANHGAA